MHESVSHASNSECPCREEGKNTHVHKTSFTVGIIFLPLYLAIVSLCMLWVDLYLCCVSVFCVQHLHLVNSLLKPSLVPVLLERVLLSSCS